LSTQTVKGIDVPHLSQVIELPELKPHPLPGGPVSTASAEVLQSLKVRVRVVAGEASLTVAELVALREDSLLRLDRHVDAPLDVVLEGRVVARGRLVAVGDEFGLQVTEVAQTHSP
jgi:flagellar motor switch protein FliN/FliY